MTNAEANMLTALYIAHVSRRSRSKRRSRCAHNGDKRNARRQCIIDLTERMADFDNYLCYDAAC